MALADEMATDVPAIFFGDLTEDVTFTRAGTRSVDWAAANAPLAEAGEAAVTVQALVGALSAREVVASQGAYQLGDRRFHVRKAQLGAEPKHTDRVAHGGQTYQLVDWELDPSGLIYLIVGRRV